MSGLGVRCRPGDAVAVTAAPSRFLYLGIPLRRWRYRHVNTLKEPVIILLRTRLRTHSPQVSATLVTA